jgi:putative colanic acid biosynthesis glycosyltransferase
MPIQPSDRPLFSIVTITLNCVADAERTAHSVLAQDFADFEYIVKDGGSTDATPQRMQEIGVQRVVSTPDSGIYDAMNQGIQLSRGTYVVFMNAGDEFAHAGVLTEAAAYLTRQNYPGFAYGDIRSLVRHPFLQPEQPERGRLIRYPNRLGRFWLYRKMICQQAWFVRREIYTNRPFDQDYRILSDYDYLLNMVLRQRVAGCPYPQRGGHLRWRWCQYPGCGTTRKRTFPDSRDLLCALGAYAVSRFF